MIQQIHNSSIGKIYFATTKFTHYHLFPLLVLFMRIWMAKIFWYSGLTKIASWQSTIYLFKYEYAVPVIPPELAAILATVTELSAPGLLTLGFMTRLAAIPMLCMTAVIQFTYLDLNEHLYWAVLLGTIILYGPGKYSLDRLLCGKHKYLNKS